MKTRISMIFLLVGALFLITAIPAQAIRLSFHNITGDNATDAAIGEAQLFVDVTQGLSSNTALFTFGNTGPAASSICDVYFDDGTLLSIASITNSTGVSFTQLASPPNLPGGKSISFVTTAGFSADSDPPVQTSGVNPGETLRILFNLNSGGTFSDVLEELGTGELRIGIHVQGFTGGGSESFVNAVPEPSTFFLLGIGLAGLALTTIKKLRK